MAGERPVRHLRPPSRLAASGHATDQYQVASNKPSARTGDDATIAYIKRILCQKLTTPGALIDTPTNDIDYAALEELLPPLTSSNDIDVQLYAIIAVILSQFVQNWYNRMTPDGDFIDEIVKIIAHCTRGLEDRLRHVDLEGLLLDELPFLLDAHLHAVRIAKQSSGDDYDAKVAHRTAIIFNTLRPHNALSPTPIDESSKRAERENEIAWSQLIVDRILPLILPPEDQSNPCLNILVSEVFAQTILCNAVLGKASEPWLLWEGVTKIIRTLRPSIAVRDPVSVPSPIDRLEQFGLLSSTEATQGLEENAKHRRTIDIAVLTFWAVMQQVVFVLTLLRSLAVSLMRASSIPPRPQQTKIVQHAEQRKIVADGPATFPRSIETEERRPIASMWVWVSFSRLISLQTRMPWLTGLLSLLQWLSLYGPGRVCCTNSTLDRWMSAQVHEQLLNPALLPPALQAIRSAIFPDNALAPPRVPPTSDEIIAIKRECAKAVVDVVPHAVRRVFFATDDMKLMEDDVEETLGLFGDPYLNKHLIVGILELVVVRLFPELAEEGDNA